MEKRRKILATLLASSMVFSMAACGETTTESTESASESVAETTEAAEETSEEVVEEAAYPDLGGVTIKVWNAFPGLNETVDPAADNYNAIAADAKTVIEERYNCILEPVQLEGSDGISDAEVMLASITSGEPFADVVNLDNVTLMPMVINDVLVDFTGQTDSWKVPQGFIDEATFNGKVYGFTFDSAGAEMIAYDRDFFEEIGMEKTPTDMFMEGKWSYEDFKAYLVELKTKLPEGMYPIGHYPFHWAWAAAAANGASLVDADMQVNFTDDAVVEGIAFYQELINEGLAAPATPGTNDEGETTYSWNYQYHDEKIAMGRIEPWQMDFEAEMNYGLVPMPWGSNVTLGTEGDYTTLSDNYETGRVWMSIKSVLKEAPSGVDPVVLMDILLDYEAEVDGAIRGAWEAEEAGTFEYGHLKAGTPRNFKTAEDMELFDWAATRNRTEWAWIVDAADLVNAWDPFRDIFAEGLDPRSVLESYEQEGKAKMEDAGFVQN